MQRPSPSIVISSLALFVSLGGSAVAARTMITSSGQIKSGSVNGSDIKNGSITNFDLKAETITESRIKDGTISADKLSSGLRSGMARSGGPAAGAITGTEVVRRAGPMLNGPGGATVATMRGLPAGSYAVFAKMTFTPLTESQGLGELVRDDKSGTGHCVLDVGGEKDDARESIANPGTRQPSTVNLQLTRTLGAPADAKLICDSNIQWRATDASIIAIKLNGSTRSDVTG